MTFCSQSYWDSVCTDWRTRRPHTLWREFADRQQIGLLARWAGARIGRSRTHLLKTDLFDEVASEGIVPWLLGCGATVCGIDVAPASDPISRRMSCYAPSRYRR